jgi:hypothetical protein
LRDEILVLDVGMESNASVGKNRVDGGVERLSDERNNDGGMGIE